MSPHIPAGSPPPPLRPSVGPMAPSVVEVTGARAALVVVVDGVVVVGGTVVVVVGGSVVVVVVVVVVAVVVVVRGSVVVVGGGSVVVVVVVVGGLVVVVVVGGGLIEMLITHRSTSPPAPTSLTVTIPVPEASESAVTTTTSLHDPGENAPALGCCAEILPTTPETWVKMFSVAVPLIEKALVAPALIPPDPQEIAACAGVTLWRMVTPKASATLSASATTKPGPGAWRCSRGCFD